MTDSSNLLINGIKPPDYVALLMSRSKPRPESTSNTTDDFKINIGKCLMELNKIDEVSWILQALEFSSFLHLIFDLDKCLVGTCKDEAEGYFLENKGELVVAASRMDSDHRAFLGTLAHELTHWAMALVFENNGLPYRRGSKEGEWYRKILEDVAKETILGNLHDRFKTVFERYKKRSWEFELIVVVPHLLAQFPIEFHWPTESTRALFEFFRISILPEIKTFVSEAPSKYPQRKTIAELNTQIGLHQRYIENDIKFESGYNDSPVLVIGCDHPTVTLFKVLRNFGNNQNVLCCNYSHIMGDLGNKIINCFNELEECRALVIVSDDDEGENYYTNLRTFCNIVKEKASKKLILIVNSLKFDSIQNTLRIGSETFAFLKMECIKENLTMETLTEKSKNYLLEASVNFRGEYITLEDLVSLSERPLIDGMLIERFLLREDILIGSDCSGAISYDPDFIISNELVDEHNLIRMVSNCKISARIAIFIEAESLDFECNLPTSLQYELCRIIEAKNILSYFVATAEELECKLQSYESPNSVPVILVTYQADQSYTSFLRCIQQYYNYSFAYWIHVKPDKRTICTGTHCPGLTFNRKLLGYNEDSESNGLDAQQFIDTEILPRGSEIRAVVLCDKAGTGKSWFLNALFGKLSNTHWVVKIILKFAKESVDALPSSDLTDEHVLKFIKYHENVDDEFAERFLKHKIRNDSKYRLLLIFDGVEEIPWTETCTLQQNREKIAHLIKYLAEETCVQTITATRPEDKIWLSNFPCRVYKLKSLVDCHAYITAICETRMELCGMSVGPNFEQTVSNYIDIAKNLLDTPLHINMLVEIVAEDILNSGVCNKVNSVAALYKGFMNIRYRDFLKGRSIPRILQSDMTKSLRGLFQRLALFYLLSNTEIFKGFLASSDLFENRKGKLRLNTGVMSNLYAIGLITKNPSQECEFQFIHQTFPEYLASELILSWIQKDIHEKLVVEVVLCNPVVSFGMLNEMLKNQTVPDKQISKYAEIMENGQILDTLRAIDRLAQYRFENMLDLCSKCILKSRELLKLTSSEYYFSKIQSRSKYMYPYPLLPISEFNSDDVIKTYLELGFNVNHVGPNGRVMMHNLVKRGKFEMVQFIVQRWTCELDVEDNDGISLIHEAASNGNLEFIKWLHSQDLCLLKLCKRDKSAVDYAIEHDNWDVAMWILNERTDDKNLEKNKHSLLLAVCDKGREDILINLLNGPWKDEVNKGDSKGFTPLHLAIERGHLNIAKILVDAGADWMAKSNDGSSIIHFAARCGDPTMIKWFLNFIGDRNPSFINFSDHAQRIPLHIAAEAGHFEAVKLMIKAGADMSVKSENELSLLHYAVISGNHLLVEWVLQKVEDEQWFDVNCTTTTGLNTPILLAAEHGHLKIITALVEAKGDIMRRSENDYSIMHYAVISESFDVVDWCLRNVPKELIDSRDNEGRTPIHLAAKLGLHPIVEKLHGAGGNLTLLSHDKASVLHYVAESGKPFLVKWCLEALRELQFNVNSNDKRGRTPLDIAAGKNDRRTMKFLTDYGGRRSYQHSIVVTEDERSMDGVLGRSTPGEEASFEGGSPTDSLPSQGQLQNVFKDILYLAVEQNNVGLVQTIVMTATDLTKENTFYVDDEGRTPLHLAVENKNAEIVQLIMAYSPGKNMEDYFDYKDKKGRTPLHRAVELGELAITQLLVQYGSHLPKERFDLHSVDRNVETPLQVSIDGGHQNLDEGGVRKKEKSNEERVQRELERSGKKVEAEVRRFFRRF